MSVEKQYKAVASYSSSNLISSVSKKSGKKHYYFNQKGRRKRKYIRKSESAIITNIRTQRYLKTLIQVIDKDISLLESISNDYKLPQHECINKLLPKVYRLKMPPMIGVSSQTAEEWKKKKEAEKAKYPTYRPEDLIHTAQDGTKMRSLSEVNIANYLLSLGITFVYELPMVVNGKMIRPDFTILSPIDNKTEIIIEHQGAMSSENYQAKFIRTMLIYLDTDLVPNKDVFFTFNHNNGRLDLRQIDYILHIAFGFEANYAKS